MERERAKLRDKMSGHEKQLAAKKEPPANNKVPKNLRIGDSVKVLSMNLKGTVSSLPNAKGDLTVQMGILNSTVNIRDLVLLEDETSPSSKKTWEPPMDAAYSDVVTSSSSLIFPSARASKMRSIVITFVTLAGGLTESASFS